jgi:hypothetical protein
MNIFSSAVILMSEILSYVIEFTEIFLLNLLTSNSETDSKVSTTEQPEESFEMV